MLLFDLSGCGPADFLRIIYLFKLILKIAFIIIPIGLIIFITIDLFKNVISNNDKDQQKNLTLIIKRIIYAVLVFFVPTIVNLVVSLLSNSGVMKEDYSYCYENINLEDINYLDSVEYSYELAEKYVRIAETKLTEESFSEAQKYIDALEESKIKKDLQNRLDRAREYAKDNPPKENNPGSGNDDGKIPPPDGYAPTNPDSCSTSGVVLTEEPDPTCIFNHWGNVISKNNFIFPTINGKRLGSWPKNYETYPSQLTNTKKYNSGKLIWPVTPVNNIYGHVYEHNGMDIMAVFGTPIYSPVSGDLMYSEWGHTSNKGSDETAYTVSIIMDNPIVYNNVTYSTVFLTHMSGIIYNCASTYECKRKIKQGELIGFVGNAQGTAEDPGWAPHLHMTIYPYGQYERGLLTSDVQKLYNLNCEKNCANISIKAGG